MTTTSQDRSFRDELIANDLLEQAIDWIKNNMEPEEVFTEQQLEKWAENNNYKKEE